MSKVWEQQPTASRMVTGGKLVEKVEVAVTTVETY